MTYIIRFSSYQKLVKWAHQLQCEVISITVYEDDLIILYKM